MGLDPDLGHLVEGLPVHAAGHDRGDPRVAGFGLGAGAGQPARLPRLGGDPLFFERGGGVQAAQVGEVDVDLGQGGLPGAVGQQVRFDQPVQRLGQRVMLALLDAAVVFGAEVLAEGVEDRLQRGGAGRRSGPRRLSRRRRGWCPGAGTGRRTRPHPRHPRCRRPGPGAGLSTFRRSSGREPRGLPAAARARRHRAGSASASSRLSAGSLSVQAAISLAQDSEMSPAAITAAIRSMAARGVSARRPRRWPLPWNPGLVDQPRPGGAVPVRLIPALRGERGQHRGVDRGQLGLRPLQPGQHLPVRLRAQRRPVGGGQVIQRRVQHPGGVGRAGECRVRHAGSPPAGDQGDV